MTPQELIEGLLSEGFSINQLSKAVETYSEQIPKGSNNNGTDGSTSVDNSVSTL